MAKKKPRKPVRKVVKSKDLKAMIESGELKMAPIRHAELSPELLDRIRETHRAAGHLLGNNLEKWEVGFMRDTHPEREVAVWEKIGAAWNKFIEERKDAKNLSAEAKKVYVVTLISLSTGVPKVSDKSIPASDAKQLLASWKWACAKAQGGS